MATAFRPSTPYVTRLFVLTPEIKKVAGARAKVIPDLEKIAADPLHYFTTAPDDELEFPSGGTTLGKIERPAGFWINCSFKTYGGTERTVDGIYAIEDTATAETWYRPDIKSGCLLAFPETGALYEIVGEPEDINQRHQFMRLKVSRYKGGV